MHVETLLLLCHTRWGRDYLREHGVYEIVRAAHENETVDKVRTASLYILYIHLVLTSLFLFSYSVQISEHIERLVNLLKGDEPSGAEQLDDDDAVDGNQSRETAMSDDEDSRIEEV